MEFPVFAFALIVVSLTGQVFASKLPSLGLFHEMPSKCVNNSRSFCQDRHEKYPQEHIDEILKKYRLMLAKPKEKPFDREGPADVSSDICNKTKNNDQIYEIIDKQGNIRVVIQSELFRQRFGIEMCESKEPILTYNTEMRSTEVRNNEFECYEKTTDYDFYVLSLDGKRVESIKSRDGLPVCCSCKINN